jgi:hypothetical protein
MGNISSMHSREHLGKEEVLFPATTKARYCTRVSGHVTCSARCCPSDTWLNFKYIVFLNLDFGKGCVIFLDKCGTLRFPNWLWRTDPLLNRKWIWKSNIPWHCLCRHCTDCLIVVLRGKLDPWLQWVCPERVHCPS